MRFITQATRNRRELWLDKISVDGKVFSDISLAFENELKAETLQHGQDAILDHLRVCGHIPERYPHDSSEEKLYSKYTDSVISHAFASLGMKSKVLTERADAADVEVIAADYTFVADAKAFRLSRTAKNQKDFKVQAMDGWRGKNDFAIVVCPIYQLPKRESQIYQQAITRNVCVFSYSHLSVLVRIAQIYDRMDATNILKRILLGISKLPVSKSAEVYWKFINEQFLTYSKEASKVFQSEILAEVESVNFASVVQELKRHYKFDSKKTTITSIADNGLFSVK